MNVTSNVTGQAPFPFYHPGGSSWDWCPRTKLRTPDPMFPPVCHCSRRPANLQQHLS